MTIDYTRVSTTEQNLGLQHDDLKLAYDASVDVTDPQLRPTRHLGTSLCRFLVALQRHFKLTWQ